MSRAGDDGGSLAAEVLEAYGVGQWRAADRLMAIFSLGGAMLASGLRAGSVRCQTAFIPASGPSTLRLDPFPEAGHSGVVEGGRARLLGRDGRELASRPIASADRGGGPKASLRWDDVDVLAFAGATLWTWVALPLALVDHGVRIRERPPVTAADGTSERWRRIEVILPDNWPATRRQHVLSVDADGRVRSHTERLDLLGRSVPVTHSLSRHCEFGGVMVATHRQTRSARGAVPVLWGDIVAATLIPRVPTKYLN